MRSQGRWVVPIFLVVIGLLLLWVSSLLYADGIINLALENSQRCSQVGVPNPHPCATLATNAEEGYALLVGTLGACTLIVGLVVGLDRWSRARSSARS